LTLPRIRLVSNWTAGFVHCQFHRSRAVRALKHKSNPQPVLPRD